MAAAKGGPPDSLVPFAGTLVQAGVLSAVLLGLIWLGRVAFRQALIKRVVSQFPERAAEIRGAGRSARTLRPARAPLDPYARTHPVVVPPLGEGRPGESFWAPGPYPDGFTVEQAAVRVEGSRAAMKEPQIPVGPVDHLSTGAGPGWRTTPRSGTGRVLTDTHVDRDGWAFVIGVLSTSWHARSVEALDGILATWQWIPTDLEAKAVEGYTK